LIVDCLAGDPVCCAGMFALKAQNARREKLPSGHRRAGGSCRANAGGLINDKEFEAKRQEVLNKL
jgi:hypothetical protein